MTDVVEKGLRKFGITISKPILGVICIIFGLLVIFFKDLLPILVGIFFIVEGALLLTEYFELQRQRSPNPPPPSSS